MTTHNTNGMPAGTNTNAAATASSSLASNDLEDLEEFPLALKPTPHFLRRFNYVVDGGVCTFAEPKNAGAPSEHRLRAMRKSGSSLVPKRRANDLLLPPRKRLADEHEHQESEPWQSPSSAAGWESSSNLHALHPINTAISHTGAGVSSGSTSQDHGRSPSPSPAGETSSSALANSVVVGGSTTANHVSSQSPNDDKFNLLSPTASPRDDQVLSGDEFSGVDRLGPRISGLEVTRETRHSRGLSAALLQPFVDASGNPVHNGTSSGSNSNQGAAPYPLMGDDLAGRVAMLVDEFEQLPAELHRYALYRLFRGCNRRTLSTMVPILTNALRNDVLSRLPTELADMCLSYLDSRSLAAVSQVCRTWYKLVEDNEQLWKQLLETDVLNPTPLDFERAKHEGWGYYGWTEEQTPAASPPLNVFGEPVNIYKAVYRRLRMIAHNWMSPVHAPRHLSIPCLAQDVITCLEFDKDRIIAGSDRKHINIYDTRTGHLLHHFSDHDGGVWALKYVNHDTLVTGSTDRTIRVWSISKARCTHLFRGHGSTVRCLDIVTPVEVTDPVSGAKTLQPPVPMIVSGSRDTTLRLWRLPGPDDPEYFSSGPDDTDPYFERVFIGHTNAVRAISAHGDTIVSGSYDTSVRVWRLSTGECRWELTGHNNKVYSAVIDAKRNRCISASMDWNVKVWCIETGTLLFTLEGHTSLVGLLDLSRTTLVSAAADSTLRVWDPETGTLLHKLVGHQGPISCFQHDETKVVSGSEKKLKLWNIKTGELVGDLLDNLQLTAIWQVGFDGRRCISAVARSDGCSYLEVLDFDYDPQNPPNRTAEIREIDIDNDTMEVDSEQ